MKKRLATLAIVGAMAVSTVAPMTAFAANPATHNTKVNYISGAVNPGGPVSNYYVTIPSDIAFTDTLTTAEQKLELKALPDKTLSTTLKVGVTVTSNGGALLKSNPETESLNYNVDFTGEGADTDGQKLDSQNASNRTVGSLTPTVAAITGTASLEDKASASVAKGTVFADTLVYTITETSK